MKTTKPRFLLLDANIVIKAHELEIWTPLCNAFEIAVPSIIVRDEAHLYFQKESDQGFPISLPQQVEEGTIKEWEANGAEIAGLLANFDSLFQQIIDSGEAEALACLIARPDEDLGFCTADGPAIKALAMIGMASRGLSFEAALKVSGLSRRLPPHFTDVFFQKHLGIGKQNRITGEGLSPGSSFRL